MTSCLAEGIRLNGMGLIANGTGNDTGGISFVKLFEDSNANGIYNPGENILADGKYGKDNGIVQLSIPNGYLIPTNTTAYFLIVYTMTNSSLNGDTYSFQIPSISATGASTGTIAKINGLVIYSPIFTVSSASLPTTTTTSSIITNTVSSSSTTTTAVSSSSTTTTETTAQNQNYFWIYVAGGISIAILIIFVLLYMRASHQAATTISTPQAQPGPQS